MMAGRRGVLICGYYGNYNLGDEAMLAGMIKLLQEQQDNLLITVFLGTLRTLRHVIPSDQSIIEVVSLKFDIN